MRSVRSVSVVVVTYNSEQHIETCLSHLEGRGHEVVVVDNASSDGTVELVRRRFPDVRVIPLEENIGYGAANNVGIDATTGPYVLVLNPDAWPLGDAIERLVDAAEASPHAAIVAPRLLDELGTHSPRCGAFPPSGGWRRPTSSFAISRRGRATSTPSGARESIPEAASRWNG